MHNVLSKNIWNEQCHKVGVITDVLYMLIIQTYTNFYETYIINAYPININISEDHLRSYL